MNVPCYLCGGWIAPVALPRHWQIECPGTLRPQLDAARKRAQATEPTLLAKAWEQIEDILVDQEFVR